MVFRLSTSLNLLKKRHGNKQQQYCNGQRCTDGQRSSVPSLDNTTGKPTSYNKLDTSETTCTLESDDDTSSSSNELLIKSAHDVSNIRLKLISDEDLFKQPPQNEDCPLCNLVLPTLSTGSKYYECCGSVLCSGCVHALELKAMKDNEPICCPFCRAKEPTSNEEVIVRNMKRVQVNNAEAIYNYAHCYASGLSNFPLDKVKAIQLFHQAGELGCTRAYDEIAYAHLRGDGVPKDSQLAKYYWKLAAMGGSANARYNLGIAEESTGNVDRALKHYKIAVAAGDVESLKQIHQLLLNGYATKNDLLGAFDTRTAYIDMIRSDHRDEAAAYSDEYKYY